MKKKLIFLADDAARHDFVIKLVDEGKLPSIEKLMERGVYAELVSTFPAITPASWTSMLTGTWPGTHGLVAFQTHFVGEPLDVLHSAFEPEYCRAEFLWETGRKVGKKTIMVHFPGTWGMKGPTVKEGYQVGGVTMGHYTAEEFGGFEIAGSSLFSTESIEGASKVQLREANGWNLPSSIVQALETEINVIGRIFHILVTGSKENKYDHVHICKGKDLSGEITCITQGEWSKTICAESSTKKGRATGAFRIKLLKLSNDGKIFSLYVSPVSPVESFTKPYSLGKTLTEEFGAFPEKEDFEALSKGWIGEDTHFETCEYQANWLADVSTYLMKKYSWDMFFNEFHGVDHLSHVVVGDFKIQDPDYARLSNPGYDEEKARESWEALSRMYQLSDEWIGKILKQADENTVIVAASDHGLTPSHTEINIAYVFKEAGLMDYEIDKKTGEVKINWKKTKAVQWERNFISVNLKGREPDGIVEPKDYDNVREEIISVLASLKDPRTGESRIFNIVKREEAEVLGLYGDRIGDLFLTTKPGFVAWPMIRRVRPWRDAKTVFKYDRVFPCHTFHWPTVLDNRGFLVIAGLGVKEGARLKMPIRPPDIAPTITHLLGMPLPEGNEGRILYEALA